MSGGLGNLEILEKFPMALDHPGKGKFLGRIGWGGEGRFWVGNGGWGGEGGGWGGKWGEGWGLVGRFGQERGEGLGDFVGGGGWGEEEAVDLVADDGADDGGVHGEDGGVGGHGFDEDEAEAFGGGG